MAQNQGRKQQQEEGQERNDVSYFEYYAHLVNQQNMLQDQGRTQTYKMAINQDAILNQSCIMDKLVADIGAGSGVLSYFALMGQCRHVTAIEASGMAARMQQFIDHCVQNGKNKEWLQGDRIKVIHKKLEEILPLKDENADLKLVETLISEPIGVLLLHERMVETYIMARDHLLKSPQYVDGKWQFSRMLPSQGAIVIEPISDSILYNETVAKARWWLHPGQSMGSSQQNGVSIASSGSYYPGSTPQHQSQRQHMYDIDFSGFYEPALQEAFGSPVVGPVAPHLLLSTNTTLYRYTNDSYRIRSGGDVAVEQTASLCRHEIDFTSIAKSDLQNIVIPLQWTMQYTGLMHGFAAWFDLKFSDKPVIPQGWQWPSDKPQPSAKELLSTRQVILSTSPYHPLTHWQQLRLVMAHPLAVNKGDVVHGQLTMVANQQRSYDLSMDIHILDPNGVRHNSQRSGKWALQEQVYNYNIAQYYAQSAVPLPAAAASFQGDIEMTTTLQGIAEEDLMMPKDQLASDIPAAYREDETTMRIDENGKLVEELDPRHQLDDYWRETAGIVSS